MTLRPALSAFDVPHVRASARVGTVAELLDCDERDVRRMISAGELEAHSKGKRGVRVYLDSVVAYQEGRTLRARRARVATVPNRSTVSSAAHREAMEGLRKSGIVT
jgi:excisionase family DNA binding protein